MSLSEPFISVSRPASSAFRALFLDHPHEAGESYFQHLCFTLKYAAFLIVTAVALAAHGLVPKWHQTTASDRVFQLNALFKSRRDKLHP